MEIKPGIGIGTIHFGMTAEEIAELMQLENHPRDESISASKDGANQLLEFAGHGLAFELYADESFRLCSIGVRGSGYKLFGRDIYGMPKSVVKRHLLRSANEIPKDENYSLRGSSKFECLDYDRLGLLIWLLDGNVTHLDLSVWYEPDNETIIWPA